MRQSRKKMLSISSPKLICNMQARRQKASVRFPDDLVPALEGKEGAQKGLAGHIDMRVTQ